jgi:transposase
MSSPNRGGDLAAAESTVADPVADPSARPARRRFTAQYRDRIIDEYEGAVFGQKSAVLRREGLYQSQLREWVLARESKPVPTHRRRAGGGARISDADAVIGDTERGVRRENDRLARENTRLTKQLGQTEAALEIMGKLHVLLESISQSTDTPGSSATR